ncbi:acyltransferase family protein [Levilactobacillus fujinensis]|uniref:Acyltransferase family protein n=1 Tax=Levilactobacillus fujinensis TaxID=2486024 RepID=A0ABW1TGU8_9LACO|nr:acyltransferase family protein [Levilactobacillus fujinensis]
MKIKEKQIADVGDYLKAFACTAVMGQTVLSLGLTTAAGQAQDVPITLIYAAIKFTAPAFICGILFSTMRTTTLQPALSKYYRQQWHVLGVPTLWWTLAYLLILPSVQQHRPARTIGQFIWQMINGNAAPHLWYNTMMLQMVLLMPIWWGIRRWATTVRRQCVLLGGTAIIYALGMQAYTYRNHVVSGMAARSAMALAGDTVFDHRWCDNWLANATSIATTVSDA